MNKQYSTMQMYFNSQTKIAVTKFWYLYMYLIRKVIQQIIFIY